MPPVSEQRSLSPASNPVKQTVYKVKPEPLLLGENNDGNLITQLKGLVTYRGSKINDRFNRERCTADITEIIKELSLALSYENDFRTLMEDRYLNFAEKYFAYPYDLVLEDLFKKSENPPEKKIILSLTLLSQDSYSNLIDAVMKNGSEDKNYGLCIEFLKELPEEDKKLFLSKAFCHERSAKKNKNLAISLISAFGEEFTIQTLKEHIVKPIDDEEVDSFDYEPGGGIGIFDNDDDEGDVTLNPEYSYESDFEILKEANQVLCEVIKASSKDQEKNYLFLFTHAISWDITCRALEKVLKIRYGNDKEKIADFCEKGFKNDTGGITSIRRGILLDIFVNIKREKAFNVLRDFGYKLDDPVIAHTFVRGLLSIVGPRAKNLIKDIIYEQKKDMKESYILMSLINTMFIPGKDKKGNDIKDVLKPNISKLLSSDTFREILIKEKGMVNLIDLCVKSKTQVADNFDPQWTMYDQSSLGYKHIAVIVGLEKLINWSMYGQAGNLRENARAILARALHEHLQDDENRNHKFDADLVTFIGQGRKKTNKLASEFVRWMDRVV